MGICPTCDTKLSPGSKSCGIAGTKSALPNQAELCTAPHSTVWGWVSTEEPIPQKTRLRHTQAEMEMAPGQVYQALLPRLEVLCARKVNGKVMT